MSAGDFQALLAEYAGDPVVLTLVLFAGPFVLEEAAILAGAAIAAAGELPSAAVVAILFAGIVVSDWLLYGLGAAAGRSGPVRKWIGYRNIAYGRRFLRRGVLTAGVTARLVPWLLLPVFVASGFVRVGFRKFAMVNAAVAAVYVNVLFWGIYAFNLVLFDAFAQWGWLAVAGVAAGVLLISRRLSRRFARETDAPSDKRDQG